VLEVFQAFEDGAYYQGEGYGGVFEDFGEAAAFFAGNEFAPAHGFGVGAAAEAAPVDGFGTDADAVVIAFERKFFIAAARHEFGVDAELLGPVARDTAADGKDAHFFGGEHGVGEFFEVLEGIEAEDGAAIALAAVFVEGEVEAKFGIGKSGDEDGNVAFEGGAENAAAVGVFVEKFANAMVEFPTADDFFGVPFFEDGVDNFLDVVEIGFGFERIVDAVVAGAEEFVVVHFGGIVAEVGEASGFDEAVSHEGAGGDDGFDDAGFDEVAEDEAHFADGESAGEGHDDEAVFVASHGFKDVGGVADLASGVGGVAHGADEVVDGFNFGEIEGKDGAEFIFDGVVKDAPGDGFTWLFGHRLSLQNVNESGDTERIKIVCVVY
jgi:hypothetical protein